MPEQSPKLKTARFNAPWSRELKLLTLLASVILIGISTLLLVKEPEQSPPLYHLGIWLPLVLLVLCALFTVRGYQLEGDQLLVLRPGWHSRVSLRELQSVTLDAKAMDGSIKLFGNGGLFSYLGLFRNKKLGRYRAYATDAAKAVVIKFPTSTVVVTPDKPQLFVQVAQKLAGTTGAS
ncbi:hypothetical protein Mag101_10435 [Microbulbifer agarilyticus]|uniref:Bacterial Pleckstrin homology domain-containing protein n=1 Tax=Microbulbifer agarilyticus TaxID=260552 RepID=A0A1Q2M6U3_9GAMM|nr:PH domain-containing protein [Microbulbifer agarilyticus]AQQ68007.1 hypothetical protein Mag101_10435 [Microbulbifer agarilyticus]